MAWVYHSEQRFRAHHALVLYNGAPESSHEHEWRVSVQVSATELQPEHFALDFHAVHGVLARAVTDLDGADLNQHPEIGRISPTAEALALFIRDRVAPAMADLGGRLDLVSVWEGPDNRVDLTLDF
jgi:6-pyruvoyltetrahydropterin/6-carboxytetrahydropterin synthase